MDIISKKLNIEQHDDIIIFKNDKEFAYNNLKNIIAQSMTIVPDVISSTSIGNARIYESAASLLKTIFEMNKDLIKLSEDLQNNNENTSEKENTINNTAVFIGSTEELLKIISEKNES